MHKEDLPPRRRHGSRVAQAVAMVESGSPMHNPPGPVDLSGHFDRERNDSVVSGRSWWSASAREGSPSMPVEVTTDDTEGGPVAADVTDREAACANSSLEAQVLQRRQADQLKHLERLEHEQHLTIFRRELREMAKTEMVAAQKELAQELAQALEKLGAAAAEAKKSIPPPAPPAQERSGNFKPLSVDGQRVVQLEAAFAELRQSVEVQVQRMSAHLSTEESAIERGANQKQADHLAELLKVLRAETAELREQFSAHVSTSPRDRVEVNDLQELMRSMSEDLQKTQADASLAQSGVGQLVFQMSELTRAHAELAQAIGSVQSAIDEEVRVQPAPVSWDDFQRFKDELQTLRENQLTAQPGPEVGKGDIDALWKEVKVLREHGEEAAESTKASSGDLRSRVDSLVETVLEHGRCLKLLAEGDRDSVAEDSPVRHAAEAVSEDVSMELREVTASYAQGLDAVRTEQGALMQQFRAMKQELCELSISFLSDAEDSSSLSPERRRIAFEVSADDETAVQDDVAGVNAPPGPSVNAMQALRLHRRSVEGIRREEPGAQRDRPQQVPQEKPSPELSRLVAGAVRESCGELVKAFQSERAARLELARDVEADRVSRDQSAIEDRECLTELVRLVREEKGARLELARLVREEHEDMVKTLESDRARQLQDAAERSALALRGDELSLNVDAVKAEAEAAITESAELVRAEAHAARAAREDLQGFVEAEQQAREFALQTADEARCESAIERIELVRLLEDERDARLLMQDALQELSAQVAGHLPVRCSGSGERGFAEQDDPLLQLSSEKEFNAELAQEIQHIGAAHTDLAQVVALERHARLEFTKAFDEAKADKAQPAEGTFNEERVCTFVSQECTAFFREINEERVARSEELAAMGSECAECRLQGETLAAECQELSAQISSNRSDRAGIEQRFDCVAEELHALLGEERSARLCLATVLAEEVAEQAEATQAARAAGIAEHAAAMRALEDGQRLLQSELQGCLETLERGTREAVGNAVSAAAAAAARDFSRTATPSPSSCLVSRPLSPTATFCSPLPVLEQAARANQTDLAEAEAATSPTEAPRSVSRSPGANTPGAPALVAWLGRRPRSPGPRAV